MISFDPVYNDPPANRIEALGRWLCGIAYACGRGVLVVAEAFLWFRHLLQRRSEVSRQLYIVGVGSYGVVTTVALFTGMILSVQTGLVLREYGQEANVGFIVSQTLCREMGPFMTALILAASVGSAMAAELGTMTVSEEIDALIVLDINPIRYLVMPRLFAMLVMTPVLTVYTDLIGILGGGLVAKTQLDVSWYAYSRNVLDFLKPREVNLGLVKAAVFGVIITGVSCYQGLATRNGAIGVGLATRKSVVICFLLVLITGYFMTRFFYG
ncbi:MAG: ABC transporter permease [Lentisphaerae bacterium]|nr:MAG: ABC transporter permease [Lentisphaerota bacterium]